MIGGCSRVERCPGREERFAIDRSPDVDGPRGHDAEEGVVEVVVIPVPGEPRGIGSVRIRHWREPEEQGRNEERDDGAGRDHAGSILAVAWSGTGGRR